MKKNFLICYFTLLFFSQTIFSQFEEDRFDKIRKEKWKSIVVANKKITFNSFPNAHNPSLAHTNFGLILTFRNLPDPLKPWISDIGIVALDEKTLNPLGEPQLLNMRKGNTLTPSQAEDARIFYCNGHTYLIYNDNVEKINPSIFERRDIYIAEIMLENGSFTVLKPVKLYHEKEYEHQKWQKNWVPFAWHDMVLLSYSLNPHDVLYPNFETGKCKSIYKHPFFHNWMFGTLRGGTQALLVDGEYLAFFHSMLWVKSSVSKDAPRPHYFMGAYAFSAEPPFNITKMTYLPLSTKGLYTKSSAEKRVIFPGGFYILGPYLHVAYGKDDQEIWIATIDKDLLKTFLEPVQEYIDFDEALKETIKP